MSFFIEEHLPPTFEHGWENLTGYAKPWEIDDGTIMTRDFFHAFYLAYLEKLSCGGGARGSFGDQEGLIFRREDKPNRISIEEFYINIIRSIASLFFDNEWLGHDHYSQDTFDDWWDYRKDGMIYTRTDLEVYVGPKYFELFLSLYERRSSPLFPEGPKMWELENPELWRALGKVLWLCTYRVDYNNWSIRSIVQNDDTYQFNVDLGSAISKRTSPPSKPLIGDKYIADGDSSYDEVLKDPKTGDDVIITHTWKDQAVYEWTDFTSPDRKYGELTEKYWLEVIPSKDDIIHLSSRSPTSSTLKFDGSVWQESPISIKLSTPMAPQEYYIQSDLAPRSPWGVEGLQIDRTNNPINQGPDNIEACYTLMPTHIIDVGPNPTSINGASSRLHQEEFEADWEKRFEQKVIASGPVSDTQQYVNIVETIQKSNMTNGGISLYCTDIEGTPLLADCLYSTSILSNIVTEEHFWRVQYAFSGHASYTEVEQYPLYDFPIVGNLLQRVGDNSFESTYSHPDGELLYQFEFKREMDANGITSIRPDLADIATDFGTEDMYDYYPRPLEPLDPAETDEITTSVENTNVELEFIVQRSRTAPIGEPSPTDQRPIFINTNLPDAKYFLEGAPEVYQAPTQP